MLIKITSGGICGSDIGIYNGTNSLATYPRVIGHEFGGIVVCSTLEVMGVHRDGGFAGAAPIQAIPVYPAFLGAILCQL